MRKPEYWGMECSIDLHECEPFHVRDAKLIKRFVADLCKMIKVKPFGKCIVVDFGEDERVAGFSMVQLIETSLISGHFVNQSNGIYLNIFSCKEFDAKKAANFAQKTFQAKEKELVINYRK